MNMQKHASSEYAARDVAPITVIAPLTPKPETRNKVGEISPKLIK